MFGGAKVGVTFFSGLPVVIESARKLLRQDAEIRKGSQGERFDCAKCSSFAGWNLHAFLPNDSVRDCRTCTPREKESSSKSHETDFEFAVLIEDFFSAKRFQTGGSVKSAGAKAQ